MNKLSAKYATKSASPISRMPVIFLIESLWPWIEDVHSPYLNIQDLTSKMQMHNNGDKPKREIGMDQDKERCFYLTIESWIWLSFQACLYVILSRSCFPCSQLVFAAATPALDILSRIWSHLVRNHIMDFLPLPTRSRWLLQSRHGFIASLQSALVVARAFNMGMRVTAIWKDVLILWR